MQTSNSSTTSTSTPLRGNEYVWPTPKPLSPELEKIAREQLNEEPETRFQKIAGLREMLRLKATENKSNYRDDDEFLLRFLRVRKFNLETALETVINYHNFREKYNFTITTRIDQVMPYVANGVTQVLPGRDRQGRKIMLLDFKLSDPTLPVIKMHEGGMYLMERVIAGDDETQIRGVCIVEDLKGISLSSINMGEKEDQRRGFEMLEKCFPVRMKAIYVVNAPWFMRVLWLVVRPFLSAKMKSRIFVCGTGYQKLHEYVASENLPADLEGTLSEEQYTWKKTMEEWHRLDGVEYVYEPPIVQRKLK